MSRPVGSGVGRYAWEKHSHPEYEGGGGGTDTDHYPQQVTINVSTSGTCTLDTKHTSRNLDLFPSTYFDSAGGIGINIYGTTGAHEMFYTVHAMNQTSATPAGAFDLWAWATVSSGPAYGVWTNTGLSADLVGTPGSTFWVRRASGFTSNAYRITVLAFPNPAAI